MNRHLSPLLHLMWHALICYACHITNGFLSQGAILFLSPSMQREPHGKCVSVMAFSVTLCGTSSFSSVPSFPQTLRRRHVHFPLIRAVQSGEPDSQKSPQTKSEGSSNDQSSTAAPKTPKKPVYSMKKGQIVRVDKEKYLNSINYLSVGHPPYYKGLDYIYEDRGEVLDIRIFETGEYALIAWVGIPTAPAWLPTYMLIKSKKLNYERL